MSLKFTLLTMQDQLAEIAQCIASTRSPIGHATLILPNATYMKYTSVNWQPPNGGIDPGNVVNYLPGNLTHQEIKQSAQHHVSIKTD